ncbi:hypothetical protein HDK77DRAFT_127417 [Phyllosticta capitalensis]
MVPKLASKSSAFVYACSRGANNQHLDHSDIVVRTNRDVQVGREMIDLLECGQDSSVDVTSHGRGRVGKQRPKTSRDVACIPEMAPWKRQAGYKIAEGICFSPRSSKLENGTIHIRNQTLFGLGVWVDYYDHHVLTWNANACNVILEPGEKEKQREKSLYIGVCRTVGLTNQRLLFLAHIRSYTLPWLDAAVKPGSLLSYSLTTQHG